MTIGEFAGTAAACGRVAALFGTEGDGLTDEALAAADIRVRIPMLAPRERAPGALDSLNIATAAGIALHRLHEVRRRSFREGE
jgi:tRNA G18 (ribose-2'-O)-methylase SpoU